MSALEFPERSTWRGTSSTATSRRAAAARRACTSATRPITYARGAGAGRNRFGNALRRLGVEVEDRVLLVLPDRPEFAFAWFGAAKAGAVIAMVNPIVPADDFAHY